MKIHKIRVTQMKQKASGNNARKQFHKTAVNFTFNT